MLVVGVGGLGCPAALALAEAGVGRLVLVDDDVVDRTNLHRQILFTEADVGRDKLDAARDALLLRGVAAHRIDLVRARCLPHNARQLIADASVVLEGADNFATKFLVADAAHLEARPVVHGAAIRWRATVWAVRPQGCPCYRCLFENVPQGAQTNCETAGVVGPVPGIAGALMADLALDLVSGQHDRTGAIFTYDGLSDRLRSVDVSARAGCPLCGRAPAIFDVHESRYTEPACA